MQDQPLKRRARDVLKYTRLDFILFWRQSANCVPPRSIDSPTERSIPESSGWPSSLETRLHTTSFWAGEARDAECMIS
jgi:hypothetical protein